MLLEHQSGSTLPPGVTQEVTRMPTVSLVPHGDGTATLNVDNQPALTVSVGVNGNVGVTLPVATRDDVFITRDTHIYGANTGSGIVTDATHVTAMKPGRPNINVPIESGVPDSPSPGAHPLIGQDGYLYDMLYALSTRTNTIVFGPTGCGKTASVEWLTALLNWNLVIVSITPGSNEDTILGTQLPAAHDVTGAPTVKWHDRMIAQAVRFSHDRPTVCLIDEINRIRDVNEYAALMPLLDGTARLTLPTGEVIDRGDLVLIATANPPHEYVGTNELDPAFENRLPWTPTIDYPDPVDEALALCSRIPTLDPVVAKNMCDVVHRVRQAGEIAHPVGFRSLEAWAKALDSGFFSWSEAAERALIAKFPTDEQQAVRNVLAMFVTDDNGQPQA
jgi:MoxR-like ATPase